MLRLGARFFLPARPLLGEMSRVADSRRLGGRSRAIGSRAIGSRVIGSRVIGLRVGGVFRVGVRLRLGGRFLVEGWPLGGEA
ncbi:hypothetical protein GCM10009828_064930 [Actinoplanes couchii]|uniref:Uncharacterized protein n=1 Tax=Actinoplanes couchii TaxID=403638 RepID=A0ABQ3X320_9ACTN|nr:hypothetical protein Aco03nite_012870 [Actinoplanes couchii]